MMTAAKGLHVRESVLAALPKLGLVIGFPFRIEALTNGADALVAVVDFLAQKAVADHRIVIAARSVEARERSNST